MTDAVLDWDRRRRTGLVEAVLCEPKSDAQIAAILQQARDAGRSLLLTRLATDRYARLAHDFPDLDHDPLGRTATFGAPPNPLPSAEVAIVTAGTSDLDVAAEARATLRFHGQDAAILADLGVAGLYRLLDRLDELRGYRVLIAVAGMEGALFAVLAGLVAAPIIAVPTATGYGVGGDGTTALHAALAGCGAGVVAVNVGNGFGAACAALRVLGCGAEATLDAAAARLTSP